MEFTFTYSSPERALLRKQTLEAEIDQYSADIADIQRQKSEALDELAALQTMLMQNGHTTININQTLLEAPAAVQQLPPAVIQTKAQSKLPEYNNAWSLREKMVYVYLLENPKAEWTTDDIKAELTKIEPDNDKIKNVSTIIGQNENKYFVRIHKDGSKPLFKLAKGAEKAILEYL